MPKRKSIPVPVIAAGELFVIALYLANVINGGIRVLIGALLGVPAIVLLIFYAVWGGEDRWWGAGWSLLGILVSSLVAGLPARTAFAVFLAGIGFLLLASYLSSRD